MVTATGLLLSGGVLTIGAACLLFGFLPGIAARLIALSFPKKDPRRREMIAEVYGIPYSRRPLWVFEQLERAFTEGLPARIRVSRDRSPVRASTIEFDLGRGKLRFHLSPGSLFLPNSLVVPTMGGLRAELDPATKEKQYVFEHETLVLGPRQRQYRWLREPLFRIKLAKRRFLRRPLYVVEPCFDPTSSPHLVFTYEQMTHELLPI